MTDNKYKKGQIYTIRNKNDDNLLYVGSTISLSEDDRHQRERYLNRHIINYHHFYF